MRAALSGSMGRVMIRLGVLAVAVAGVGSAANAGDAKTAQGRELFLREWVPNDPRSHGGDGLGPVFNDSSCVSCHNAGGVGGGGPASKNVDILSAFANAPNQMPGMIAPSQAPRNTFGEKLGEALFGIDPPRPEPVATAPQPTQPPKLDTTELVKAHAGFRTTRSVVLHKFGTDPGYDEWRNQMTGINQFVGAPQQAFSVSEGASKAAQEMLRVRMMNQFQNQAINVQSSFGPFSLLKSQRNATALFGAGLMDAIPDSVLLATAEAQRKAHPETAGRVARQKDTRIGRFGWKAQTPSLKDFVLTACAVELGLEVPGHTQGGLPQKPEARAKGLDMNLSECEAMISFVKSLPRPVQVGAESPTIASGLEAFEKIGCGNCHQARLGEVDGIYSDLLLHDLGPDLGDTGQYGVFTPGSADPNFDDDPAPAPAPPDGGVGLIQDAMNVDASLPELPRPFGGLSLLRMFLPGTRTEQIFDKSAVLPGAAPDGHDAVPAAPVPPEDGAVTLTAPVAAVPFNNIAPVAPPATVALVKARTGPADRQEWRTPPLWGFRDSGPYLHDGRASTLDEAVSFHGGQASTAAVAYFQLSPQERRDLQSFLKSLVAPVEAAR